MKNKKLLIAVISALVVAALAVVLVLVLSNGAPAGKNSGQVSEGSSVSAESSHDEKSDKEGSGGKRKIEMPMIPLK